MQGYLIDPRRTASIKEGDYNFFRLIFLPASTNSQKKKKETVLDFRYYHSNVLLFELRAFKSPDGDDASFSHHNSNISLCIVIGMYIHDRYLINPRSE